MELPKGVFPPKEAEIDAKLIERLGTGKATLFLGSGFSRGATNISDKEMPTAKLLAHDLAKMGSFPPDDDLMYVSDRLLSEGKADDLIARLKEIFAIKEVAKHHVGLASMPWRRIYTTNYDLVFERAANQAGKNVDSVSIDDFPAEKLKLPQICVHLNGIISNLNRETINSKFKLTNSSYISPDSFIDSQWLYPFRRDLERATAIVFVGYSLYDMEIKKLLFEKSDFADKTYFVNGPNVGEKDSYLLSKFGHVIKMGAEEFADKYASKVESRVVVDPVQYTTAFARYVFSEEVSEPRDADVENFLMHGEIEDRKIDGALLGAGGAPFLVKRKEFEKIKGMLISGSDVVVTSEFGNGKTVCAKWLLSSLALDGLQVYDLVDADDDYIADYETLSKADGIKYLVLDDSRAFYDLLEHHGSVRSKNIVICAFARANAYERHRVKLRDFGFIHKEIGIDSISSDEASQFVSIADNVGMWGADAGLSSEGKIDRFMKDGNAHISQILLAIFNSPQIKSKLATILGPILSKESFKDTIFAIAILEFLDMPLTSSLISVAATNDDIYDPNFRGNESFRAIYALDSGIVRSRSSLFGLTIIKNVFSAGYIANQLLNIVSVLNNDRGEVREIRELLKSLLRFSTVENLLPDKNKKDALVRYYEQAKQKIGWLSIEPHFWVQYAMGLITFNDFSRAQRLLDQAYSLASKKSGYHTHNIDTQQGRLFLRMSLVEISPADSADLFAKAHQVLSGVPNDAGKLRQLELYSEVYHAKFRAFTVRERVDFEHACKRVIDSLRSGSSSDTSYRLDRLSERALALLEAIVSDIKSKRGEPKRGQ